jgi:hypothetical protein
MGRDNDTNNDGYGWSNNTGLRRGGPSDPHRHGAGGNMHNSSSNLETMLGANTVAVPPRPPRVFTLDDDMKEKAAAFLSTTAAGDKPAHEVLSAALESAGEGIAAT